MYKQKELALQKIALIMVQSVLRVYMYFSGSFLIRI